MVDFGPLLTIILIVSSSCLIESKPAEKDCSSCKKLVQFSRKLSNQLKDNQVRENVAKWCVESSFGGTDKMCNFLLNDLESVLGRVDSERFCYGIEACPSLTYSRLTPPVPDNTTVECEFCLNTLTHFKEIISSPPTVNELKLVLSSGCGTLKNLRDECVRLLDENLDELFDFVRQRFDPKLFCQETRSCPSAELTAPEEKILPETSDIIRILPPPIADAIATPEEKSVEAEVEAGPECVLCHLLLHIIGKELEKNQTVEEIEHTLNNTCTKLYKAPAKIAHCQERVEKYTQKFIDLATQGVAPEVACIIFGLCQVGEDSNGLRCLNDPKISCPICKQVVETVYNNLSENKTRDEVIKALDEACQAIPSSQRTACKVYVKIYEDKLFALISEAADAGEVCSRIGLCEESSIDDLPVIKPKERDVKQDAECILCKRVFEYLYAYLQENRTQAAIEEALDKVCNELFPGPRKNTCRKFIDTYTAQILDVVLQTTDPNEACTLLNICKRSAYETEFRDIEEVVDIVPLVKINGKAKPKVYLDGSSCNMCKKVFTPVHELIVNNASAVKDAIDQVCRKVLPEREQAKCEEVINKYVDQLINVLKTQSDPEIACVLLKMCPAGSAVEFGKVSLVFDGEREENSVVADFIITREDNNEVEGEGFRHTLCTECQVVTKYIQEEMYDYKTEEAISRFMKKEVCDRLPHALLRDSCRSFMVEYGDSLIQMIALRIFDPEILCQKELRVCPSNATTPPAVKSSDFDFNNPATEETCSLCVDMVTKMELYMMTETADPKSDSLLGVKVCSSVEKKEKCNNIFHAFGQHFIQMIGYDQPRKICTVVDLCYNSANTHLLGGKKCTFGPTYWCHTSAHAEACKATNFCKTRVWKAIE